MYYLLDSNRFYRFENDGLSLIYIAKFCLVKSSAKINKQEIEYLLKASVWTCDVVPDDNSNPINVLKLSKVTV